MKFALTLTFLFGTFVCGASASQDYFSGNQLGHRYPGLQPTYAWDTSAPIENTATASTFTSAAPISLAYGNGSVPVTHYQPNVSYYQPPISTWLRPKFRNAGLPDTGLRPDWLSKKLIKQPGCVYEATLVADLAAHVTKASDGPVFRLNRPFKAAVIGVLDPPTRSA